MNILDHKEYIMLSEANIDKFQNIPNKIYWKGSWKRTHQEAYIKTREMQKKIASIFIENNKWKFF